jgi:CheY-like chemotaxis protein
MTHSTKPSQAPAGRARLKVLVVDDDHFQLDLLSALLHELGIADVSCADDGHDALQTISASPGSYHLLLIDLHMPGMDGFAFMEGLARADYRGKLIIASGQSKNVLRGATLLAKIHRFALLGTLVKPVQRGALAELLNRAL